MISNTLRPIIPHWADCLEDVVRGGENQRGDWVEASKGEDWKKLTLKERWAESQCDLTA